MKNSKLQEILLFIMNYGWAILIILIALGALFYLEFFTSEDICKSDPANEQCECDLFNQTGCDYWENLSSIDEFFSCLRNNHCLEYNKDEINIEEECERNCYIQSFELVCEKPIKTCVEAHKKGEKQ